MQSAGSSKTGPGDAGPGGNDSGEDSFLIDLAVGVIWARAREEAKWKVSFENVESVNDFFAGLNCHFGVFAIRDIWGDQAEYFTAKFNSFKYADNQWDLWKFYNSLDQGNRRKLVMWYNTLMDKNVSGR